MGALRIDMQPWDTAQFDLNRLFPILKRPYPRFRQSLHRWHNGGVRRSAAHFLVAEIRIMIQRW